jgi:23S rRNA pseudouridine2605 synthase
MHPRFEVSKIYFVRTQDPVKPHQIDKLRRGVELEDGTASADRVTYIRADEPTDIAMELHEGRNRQIRRMLESMGHSIKQLDRVKYAGLTNGNLDRGHWRRLGDDEVTALRRQVDLVGQPH